MSYQVRKWMHPHEAAKADGYSAIIYCPKCDQRLGLTHQIADDGTVSPSLVCTHEPCDFHEFVQLVGWPDAAPKIMEI